MARMHNIERMVPTLETAILYSALELAEKCLSSNDSVKLQSIKCSNLYSSNYFTQHSIKTTRNGAKNAAGHGVIPIDLNKTNIQDVICVLTQAINEITSGVECKFAQNEEDFWKFQVTTMLVMLAMSEEKRERNGSFHVEPDEYGKHFELLDVYPKLSFDLVFSLICQCKLELAFIDVLQRLDVGVNLAILKKVFKHLNWIVDKRKEEENGSMNIIIKEFGALINAVYAYIFLHSNGLLSKMLTSSSQDVVNDFVEFINTVLKFVIKLFSDMRVGTYINNGDTDESNGIEKNDYNFKHYSFISTIIIGLMNFTTCIENGGQFVGFDMLNLNPDEKSVSSQMLKTSPKKKKVPTATLR